MFWTVSLSMRPSESSIGILRSQPEERSSSISLRVIPVRRRPVRTRARAQKRLRQRAQTCEQSDQLRHHARVSMWRACAPRRLISSSNAMELFRVPRRRVAFETLRTIPVNFAFVSPLRNVRSLAPVRSASDRPHQAWGAGSGKHEPQTRLAHRIAAHGSPGVMSSSSSRGQPQDTVGSAGSLAVLFALRGLGPMLLDPFFFLRSSLGSIDARRVGAGGAWLFVITATTSSVCRCSLRSTAEARGGVAAIRVCGWICKRSRVRLFASGMMRAARI